MAVTATFTAGEIVTAALRKVGVVAKDEDASDFDMAESLKSLNWMLKGWQSKEWLTWTYTRGTLTLTTAASYTLDPVRPIRILNARLKRSGIETPMVRMTREEYDTIPQKTSTGLPTQFYYDRSKEAALLYVWPVLSVAAGETIEYSYERELEDITASTDTLDMPVEWHECVIYNLASRLTEDYPDVSPSVAQKVDIRAEMLLDDLLAEDREGSVTFVPDFS
jgi:hypothetical protein